MLLRKKQLNIYLIILALILGGLAVWISGRPSLVLSPSGDEIAAVSVSADSVVVSDAKNEPKDIAVGEISTEIKAEPVAPNEAVAPRYVRSTRFKDIDAGVITAGHPFKAEAMKVLSGRLEETDSANRHQILSYCEHLRTSYTTRDIDFLRQVFSDNALIIVGHVVKSGSNSASGMSYSPKVTYSIRSKQEYLSKLAKIFATKKKLDVKFSEFKILRHPTVPGIYGVTLRQKYACDTYSDDGYLFLLWDFRDPSMPLIHVRTWQPSQSIEIGGDEIIDMSDFNLN